MATLTANVSSTATTWPISAPLAASTRFLLVDDELVGVITRATRDSQRDPFELECEVVRGVAGTQAAHSSGATLTERATLPLSAGGGGITVDNQDDPPAAVTTLIAPGATIAGDEAEINTFPGGWAFDTGASDFLHNVGAGVLIGDLTENTDFAKVEPGRITVERAGGGAAVGVSSDTQIFDIGSSDGIRLIGGAGGDIVLQVLGANLGFFNATPVDQPAAVADATDAASTMARLNDLLARLRELGLIAT